ncbi:Molybdopterin-synthase adenylyltransferase [Pseudomonas ogarae]|uniref:ThiF family adenylyltransferase n=1 Tax=Pseudomonas ogarae (strain DSM 112162 / CECT 30235 / F113) TaxID=1114970 RepID=UPI000BB2D06B|nr:ThiF family adenylyltransferase [Pseudomonas ogarae]PBJ21580.1 Molybdopterin-synthase adenylyltransferase [Pseudomonas ogarae]
MNVDLTFQEEHLKQIRSLVLREDGVEGAAYVLYGESNISRDPWTRERRKRLTSHTVLAIPDEDLISADNTHITWSTASFVRLLKRAADEGLVVGIVHTHPNGPASFSSQDDENEAELARFARNRNGKTASLISVLLAGPTEILARIWSDVGAPIPIPSVRSLGRSFKFLAGHMTGIANQALARQALAFGSDINDQLQTMRIGVVGGGGTGSATATLLARLGVGSLVLFDEDIVEVTNLNRLHGARSADADAMRPKVDVLARVISEMGIGARVVPIQKWIGDEGCQDALKSCDLIFGCTDDNDGRLLLNRLAYFYLIPVIDMGLAIEPFEDGRRLRDLSGRVTVLLPGAPCLLCRGIVDPTLAREESLKRIRPEEYSRQKREAYVHGADNPAPAVVTFTTGIACIAVDEMLQGLTGFRGDGGWTWQRVRRFDLMQDRRPGASPVVDCPICSDRLYWGRGDLDLFLDRVG